ncbi:hypothetical protein [Rickettsia endosymbiont of Polydrusus tereticollis]|uniref:hypothetical protein n=1 Tax=Rickettsia endosymbiont of Polydrusus tereticollis TaxID=3066251 RepID=UPI003132ED94
MKSKDYNCVQKFVHEYPWLFQKIIDHHPEYLIDRSIVNLVALDKEKLWFGNSPHQPINIICQNNYTSESLKEEGWVILGEDATGNY